MMTGLLSKEHNVAIKALEVKIEIAKRDEEETVCLLPIHAERILDALTLLIETINTEEKPE